MVFLTAVMWCFTDEPPPGLQGAMQLTFRKLGFDYYPIHRPGECDDCDHDLTVAFPEALHLTENHSVQLRVAVRRITIQAD